MKDYKSYGVQNRDDLIKRAGRSVLGGVVSLTLATSVSTATLVPVAAHAEDVTVENAYDAPTGTEDVAQTNNVPCIAGVFGKNADDAMETIRVDATYASRIVTVTLANQVTLDRLATYVRLFDNNGFVVCEKAPRESEEELCQATSVSFELSDRAYAKAQFVIADHGGNSAELWTGPFAIDSEKPIVQVGYSQNDARTTHGTLQFFDCPQAVPLSICDASLDLDHTRVNGIALGELLQKTSDGEFVDGTVTYGPWEHVLDPDGRDVYRSTVTFGDGVHALPIVQAEDSAGWKASDAHGLAPDGTSGFVVDTHAPAITVRTSTAPSFSAQRDDNKTALFFSGSVGLTFSFEDVSDIVSVELDEESKKLGMSLELDQDLTHATLALPHGILHDGTSVAVRDRAGNERVWSMSKFGRVMEAGYEAPAQNEPILDPVGRRLCEDGHPTMLVEDQDAPEATLSGIKDGAWLQTGATISLDVTDDRLGYLATYDPERVIAVLEKDGVVASQITAGYRRARAKDTHHRYELDIPVRPSHEDDGSYRLTSMFLDVSGKRAEESARSFVVDTTPPVLSVRFVDEGRTNDSAGLRYLCGRRTAVVTVVERNLSLEELNGSNGPVTILPLAADGASAKDVHVGAWRQGAAVDEFVCDVTFAVDGRYSLRVSGKDRVGNSLTGSDGTTVDEDGTYTSDEFVVDTTAPRMTFDLLYDPNDLRRHEGREYFRRPVTAKVTVTDRNLDVRATSVTDAHGREFVPSWEASKKEADGTVAYVAYVTYDEGELKEGWANEVLQVKAEDCASNTYVSDPYRFVVDQTAPLIQSASVSKRPHVQAGPMESDPWFFYNGQDGTRAVLRFVVSDEHLLDALWVDDPDDAYDVRCDDAHGRGECAFELVLKDQVADDAEHDTDYERNVRLFVQDLAGNTRIWTIDRNGGLVADRATDASNVSLDGLGVYPLALVYDVTAPTVRIEGVEAGRYYNSPQEVRVLLDERNFRHIQEFDPSRIVVTFSRSTEPGSVGQDHWSVGAGRFEGSGSRYSFSQGLASDGHYRVEAQFVDMAGNASARAQTGEFTLDSTSPVASVVWDNTDVRNEMYYNAHRTATLTVVEHNFDESLMEIVTTGTVGPWTSKGDVHTCQVRFDTDAPATSPHSLVIRGRDRAGNEMDELVEPSFVIDTQPPTVAFRRRVSDTELYEVSSEEAELLDKSAFCEAMMPIVVYEDEANLDPQGINVSMRGKRSVAGTTDVGTRQSEMVGPNAGRTYWDNLGLESQGDTASYRMSADDVYTISAEVVDMAGNSSGDSSVTFSLNRYGSNFFFDEMGGSGWEPDEGGADAGVLLSKPPRIVVHEVNVSGMAMVEAHGNPREDCAVTKEHAHASSQIARTDGPQKTGFTLEHIEAANALNPYEGWSEYEYVVAPGNFGKGSDSDHGDGGQGAYTVDVSSRDMANNENTTAQFWSTSSLRTDALLQETGALEVPAAKDATVRFSLDEYGPAIEDVDVPTSFCVGSTYRASFHLSDEITSGDVVQVLVDGEPVEVYGEGDASPLEAGEPVRQGTFYFDIGAKPAIFARDVEISVEDYTGLKARAQTVHMRDFRLTTLFWELGSVVALLVLGLGIAVLWRVLRGRFGYTR